MRSRRAAVSSLVGLSATAALTVAAVGNPASAQQTATFSPGNLVVSRTLYTADPSSIVPGVTQLPAGCTSDCVTAVADGGYPEVFNNESVDPSFGVTSPIYLDQMNTAGQILSSFAVPTGTGHGRNADRLVTSFPSKSEVALNLSTDGQALTFMGYVAQPGAVDVSNSNTPGVVDPTDPVGTSDYRAVAQIDKNGHLTFTETNAYSGNNGRAAILDSADNLYYTAGNAGNGANPQPTGVIAGAGAQILSPTTDTELDQAPGTPTPVGAFSITQLGLKADKVGKDTNFRGLTISDNVVYLTKGSGSNGVNTVYFIDTTGTACPNGVGLPVPGAKLPTHPLSYDPSTLQSTGLPTNMCILEGFPTQLAKSSTDSFPFGLWFADPTTLYVADEGNGTATYDPMTNTYTAAASQTKAGLQKWVLSGGSWHLAYTLRQGLDLGTPYTVNGYPTGTNPATGLPWTPATDGLRNLAGRVNPDGTVSIFAITSTVSGATDTGADPNRLVTVTDSLGATSAGSEAFRTLRTATSGEALRGVSFTPGS